MGICAYCSQDQKLTKEHIVPSWFINIDRSPDDSSFLERAKKSFDAEMVIKDVCTQCNNTHLSKLDQYGRGLYTQYFSNYTYACESVEFEYDYDLLVKWLIKCAFNSARAHNTDLEILSGYAQHLISDSTELKDVLTYCALIAPGLLDSKSQPLLATKLHNNSEIFEPYWFRVGVFRVPDLDTIDYCFRTIIINSYAFFLIIPKIGSNWKAQKRALLSKMSDQERFGEKLSLSGKTMLLPPTIDAIRAFAGHVYNNPSRYGLEEVEVTKKIREEDIDVVHYLIPREDVEAGNIEEVVAFLEHITGSRETALTYMQRIEFSVDGYSDDPRELYEINEVVRYLGKLNKLFPYWIFFQHRQGKWVNALITCLSKNEKIGSSGGNQFVSTELRYIDRHVNRWFVSLNELCHRFSFGETINRKISEDFISKIKETFKF